MKNTDKNRITKIAANIIEEAGKFLADDNVEEQLNIIMNHPDENDVLDWVDGVCICEAFETSFTVRSFMEMMPSPARLLEQYSTEQLLEELKERATHIKYSVQYTQRWANDPYAPRDFDYHSEFSNHENIKDAEKSYNEALELKDIYTVQLCQVLESTD